MEFINIIKKIGIRAFFYKLKFFICPNEDWIKCLCAREGAYKYLEKYEKLLDNIPTTEYKEDNTPFQTIWVCWLQGIDNAPLLVQKCIQSLKHFAGNLKVVVLDNNNITDYIEIPEHIAKKYEQGIIKNTFYSDYVRIAILKKYGGIWIDSTTYLTNEIPSYILESQLFCFRDFPVCKVNASNWFIAAKKGHPIIEQMELLLNEYWRNETHLVSYSIFHLFFTMIIYHNERNNKLWNTVPFFMDGNCKLMQNELFDTYSEKRFKQLCEISPIHKLSYKFSEESFNLDNTIYQYIMRKNF